MLEGGSMGGANLQVQRRLLAGLLEIGILQGGTVDQLYDARIQSLFMPHSLGHSVGIDVHDPGQTNPLQPGMVMTVEPGCYFYPTLLGPAYDDPLRGPFLNRELIESTFITMGGIRIEDVVVVQPGGAPPLNL